MTTVNFVHFKYLPMSLRVLFTMVLLVLGCGYSMAMIQVWVTHVGLDGKSYLTEQDLIIAYSGNKEGSKIETALHGPMKDMAPPEQKQIIYNWVHAGATEDEYNAKVKPILEEHCTVCHNPATNPQLPNLTDYEGVSKVATHDTGMTIPTLVRVSHIHLFGITFIFFITGFIYTHAYVRPMWFKCVVIAVPFLSLVADVAAWYLTKVWEGFAWAVILGGLFYGLAFTIQWVTSMWQMWFWKVPAEISDNAGQIPCVHTEN
jgi:hypothetical protein